MRLYAVTAATIPLASMTSVDVTGWNFQNPAAFCLFTDRGAGLSLARQMGAGAGWTRRRRGAFIRRHPPRRSYTRPQIRKLATQECHKPADS